MFGRLLQTIGDNVATAQAPNSTSTANAGPGVSDLFSDLMGNNSSTEPLVTMDQKVMDVLVDENRKLKSAIEKTGQEAEDLRDQLETLTTMESEANEEN